MLTNWSTINKSIKKMKELEGLKSNPKNEFTKKEILKISNQHEKLLRSLNGISEMKKSPDLLFIIDTRLEHIAVAEAKNLNIPIIVHTRNAEIETFDILKSEVRNSNLKILIHCFTGSKNFAHKLLDLGCYISFSGIITFKKNNDLQNVAKSIPIDLSLIHI